MGDLDSEEFARWWSRAADTLALAGQTAEVDAAWACFLAEQAAQLGVKGLLHGMGEGSHAWGHDLLSLAGRAAGVVGPEGWSAALSTVAARLSRHYIPTRYPDAGPGPVAGRYSLDDARAASQDAGVILGAVDRAWADLGGSRP